MPTVHAAAMNCEATLQHIRDRLGQAAIPAEVIEELLPCTRSRAVTWAQRLPAWDEYRGQYSDQAVALARVVSLRAMRAFALALSADGRVVGRSSENKPWPTPTLRFVLRIGGEEVRVEYTPDYIPGGGRDLFSFVSPHAPRRPRGLSETGYLAQCVPRDAVEACGGVRAYAVLFAEAQLRGDGKAFDATFEGTDPQTKPSRRRKSPVPASPPAEAETPPPVLGEHTARVVEGAAGTRSPGEPPCQGMLF